MLKLDLCGQQLGERRDEVWLHWPDVTRRLPSVLELEATERGRAVLDQALNGSGTDVMLVDLYPVAFVEFLGNCDVEMVEGGRQDVVEGRYMAFSFDVDLQGEEGWK